MSPIRRAVGGQHLYSVCGPGTAHVRTALSWMSALNRLSDDSDRKCFQDFPDHSTQCPVATHIPKNKSRTYVTDREEFCALLSWPLAPSSHDSFADHRA